MELYGNDFIWRMKYSQFKNHYSDCKTVQNSYDASTKTIEVIIPEDRLKNNGVRGHHFSGWEFQLSTGEIVCYRAVSEANARKQLIKDFPNEEKAIFTHCYRR